MPLSWKIGAAVAGVIVAAFAWNGLSQYLAARKADEITRDSARTAMLQAEQARAQAQQDQARLAADLKQRREDLSNTYQQVDEQARQYQAAPAVRGWHRHHPQRLKLYAGCRQCRSADHLHGRHGDSTAALILPSPGRYSSALPTMASRIEPRSRSGS